MIPKSDSKKIVVAMSGGVDSAVAALLLRRAGFTPIGVTLLLSGDFSASSRAALAKLSCQLGIEHHYLDWRREFEDKVIRHCAEIAASGRTPNPCCVCNPLVKFAALFAFADELSIAAAATGHYVGISSDPGASYLLRGNDAAKDQSYFLYRLPPVWLSRLHFPLSGLTKPEVRRLAAEAQLAVAEQPDSQDICFAVPGESCGRTLLRRSHLTSIGGDFIYDGKVVGHHHGIAEYTIGQRKGLNVALGKPGYVKSIDPESGAITLVTEPSQLESQQLLVTDTVWHGENRPDDYADLSVKIRFRSPDCPCRVTTDAEGNWKIESATPFRAATPGQAAVIYQGRRLLGGGVIVESRS